MIENFVIHKFKGDIIMHKQKKKQEIKKWTSLFSKEFLTEHRLTIINAAILLLSFILILILNLHTCYVSDDFKYRFVFTTMGKPSPETKPLSHPIDIIISMIKLER